MKQLTKKQTKKITEDIRRLLSSEEFKARWRVEKRWFTRSRKLGFHHCVVLIMSRLTRSLTQEMREMFEDVGLGDPPTEQAFSKSRQRINPEAFKQMYEISRDNIEQSGEIRRYRGYRMFGVDGSEIIMPSSAALWEEYPPLGNEKQSHPHGRISVMCELLDGYTLDARLVNRSVSERTLAEAHLNALEGILNERDIVMMDRGYPSRALIARLSRAGGPQFVIRVPTHFSTDIDRNPGTDFMVTFEHGGAEYPVRIVRVTLPTGEIETLITSLGADQFETESFLELYALRWGVETAYNRVKHNLALENFSGRSVITIQQEFYGAMFLLNYAAAFAAEATEEIAKEHAGKGLKHTYQANFNLIVLDLKRYLPDLLLAKSSRSMNKILKKLKRHAKDKPCPVRPDRSFPRGNPSHKFRPSPPRTGL